jgi:predicted PurR-regulated permease PerM
MRRWLPVVTYLVIVIVSVFFILNQGKHLRTWLEEQSDRQAAAIQMLDE